MGHLFFLQPQPLFDSGGLLQCAGFVKRTTLYVGRQLRFVTILGPGHYQC